MRIGVVLIWVLAALSLGLGTTARAVGDFEEEDLAELYGDEEMVSIATGLSKPIHKAPAVASVITAADIKAMGARDLDEVLETVPGLHVSLSALSRLDSAYSIRGIHTGFNPQVLVLMNGIPFSLPFNGGRPPLFRLPVSAIARVEVIRGPGSAVFGADAYAGVINVITKEAGDIRGTEVGGRAGSFDTYDLWTRHGGTYGGWDMAFSLEWQQSDGDRDRRVDSDAQTILDDENPTDASLAPGPLETRYDVLDAHFELSRENWKLRFWSWLQDDAGLGAGGAQALDPVGGQDGELYLLDLTYHNDDLVRNWELSANLHYLYQESDARMVLLPPGTSVELSPGTSVDFPDGVLGNPSLDNQQTGIDLTATYSGMGGHRWRLGSGFKYQEEDTSEVKNFGPGIETPGIIEDVSDTRYVFMPDSSRDLWYASLQDEWKFARDWELTAGVRYDDYSDFGSTVNPRLALVWATRHNLTSKLLYGRAFRAPSFSEQFAINNPVILGNPSLDPETINTLELSFDYRHTYDLQTVLSLFAYRADDLVEFVPDPDVDGSVAQNARDQEGYGFEFEMEWEATERLNFSGNYAWQHSEDSKTGERIADAPGQQLRLAADWNFLPGWFIYPELAWVADRKRAPEDSRSEIDDYIWVDLTLRRIGLAKHWDIDLAVRNLFDEDAREPSNGQIPDDYPLEGRSLWGGITYRF